jgi:hypothetical protein
MGTAMTANADSGCNSSVTISVGTVGGDIVYGDKVAGDKVAGDKIISTVHLDNAFGPVAKVIEAVAPEHQAAAMEKLSALKAEAAKGKGANASHLATLADDLIGLVPGAVSAVVSAFGNPLLSGIAGPTTKYVLENIQGK